MKIKPINMLHKLKLCLHDTCFLNNNVPGHFTYYPILLCLSNKPNFLIQPSLDWMIFASICLAVPLDILCILEFTQCLYAFFIRTSKVLMTLNVFLKVYSRKTFLLCSYFVLNIRTCTAKITLGVNNSLYFYMMWKSYGRRFSAC